MTRLRKALFKAFKGTAELTIQEVLDTTERELCEQVMCSTLPNEEKLHIQAGIIQFKSRFIMNFRRQLL